MTREDAKAILVKYISEAVPELQPAQINPDQSYKDIGVDSLALMTVLNGATKELKVKVPREKLATVNTVNELAGLLAEAANARA